MIRVEAPSRLHFGLLSFPSGEHWPNLHGEETIAVRQFGGVGMMIAAPGVSVTARPAAEWSAEGLLADRALAFAHRFAATVSAEAVQPQHLAVNRCPTDHAGLGTGTQLGLAVAQLLTTAWGLPALDVIELARRVGRGARSSLGIHGFAQGGFLVEAGKRTGVDVAPLVARTSFPEAWRIVLILPREERGLHGSAESDAFQCLTGAKQATTEALCRLVLLGMLPALHEVDLEAFGEALFDFNARVGDMFAGMQGGTYASQRIAERITFLRRQRVRGVGQSSWGPAVFAVVADAERAVHLASQARDRLGLADEEVLVTSACNRPAQVQIL